MGRIQETSARAEVLGAVIGFGLIMSLPEETGWPVIFGLYALLAATGALLALRRLPETRPVAAPEVARSRALPPRLARLMVIVFTTGVSTAMIAPIYLIFLQDRFTTEIETLAWAFLPAGIVYSILPSRLGGLGDRLGRVPMMALGLVAAGILSALLPFLPGLGWLVVLYTPSAVGWSLADPAEAALVADIAGEDRRGTGYGLYAGAHFLGLSIGPLAGGWLYDRIGQAVPFFLNGAILLFSAVWVLLALRDGRRSAALTARRSR
jgi:MFS family permease